jgi:glycosyltransferase involved in cell wall biosynthesis
MAQVLFAPNPELCALLERTTGRPCHLMPRGVDANLFHPGKRTREAADRERILGFVGRLSIEKNIGLLAKIQEELDRSGVSNFRFLIVGHGGDEAWLRKRLPQAEFTGMLRGETLAAAYANMDLFVFPSHTDTFGNVVLEALASGVPAIVTPDGGPRTIVRDGETGRIVHDNQFSQAIAGVLGDPVLLDQMRRNARAYALNASWNSVFEGIYADYETILPRVALAGN